MRCVALLCFFFWSNLAHAAVLTYNASTNVLTVGIPILVADTAGNPLTGQTTATISLYYYCGGAAFQFNATGDTLTEVSATNHPGQYIWTSDDAVAINCPEPNGLTISGVGTDRVAWGQDRFDMSNGTLDPAEIAGTITGTVVSSADCTNSATTFDTTLATAYAGTNGPREAGLRFTSGALVNEVRRIGGYNTNGCTSVNQAFSGTPAAGDAFVVVNQ